MSDYFKNINEIKFEGERALLEKILNYLVLINSKIGIKIAKKIAKSDNMTLSITGLKSLCLSNNKIALEYLNDFYLKWSDNDLVLEKWFEMMSSLNLDSEGINHIKTLMEHKSFDIKNPNKIRSVLGAFHSKRQFLLPGNPLKSIFLNASFIGL